MSCDIPLSMKANTIDTSQQMQINKALNPGLSEFKPKKAGGFCTLHKAVLQVAASQGNTHAPTVSTI